MKDKWRSKEEEIDKEKKKVKPISFIMEDGNIINL
jgi:hypothetical protein